MSLLPSSKPELDAIARRLVDAFVVLVRDVRALGEPGRCIAEAEAQAVGGSVFFLGELIDVGRVRRQQLRDGGGLERCGEIDPAELRDFAARLGEVA